MSAADADSPAVLVVRPSSLGDIVYALAVATDIRRNRPDLAVDWVAEPGFEPLVAMCTEVRAVVPFNLRRWRGAPLAARTWREVRGFVRGLRSTRYAAILDLQEQVKGALIARLARGPRHGFDRASIREPLATLGDDFHHRVSRKLHFVARVRALAGAALGYGVEGLPAWKIAPPASSRAMPSRPYVVLLHGTSRAEKLWAEDDWRALIERCEGAGYACVLPWGDASEEARSRRLAAGFDLAVVPPRLSVPEVAAMLARSELVVGVDTGFTHLAAALVTPTLAIFCATDRRRHGVACAGPHAIDLGDAGAPPSRESVIVAAGKLLETAPD
ncbi:MAG TPA: lipopolysaccharide heptosyltransferase I [Casimicrobiaceae bacterium]